MPEFRPHLQHVAAYSSARDEFTGSANIFLDANENPYESNFNRYPDPLQQSLRNTIAQQWRLRSNEVFIGNGSDEAIDLLIRAVCEPSKDAIAICEPTYGMYSVVANINNVEIINVPLLADFQPDVKTISQLPKHCKMVFLCTPNNPTGNCFHDAWIEQILENDIWVVVDEAYVQFANKSSWSNRINEFSNLVVLQTFSKAFGCAGLRVGMAFSNSDVIDVLQKIKPPYNINTLSQQKALEVLQGREQISEQLDEIKNERSRVAYELNKLDVIKKVYPSEANFLLFQVANAHSVYYFLLEKGIVVRNRDKQIANTIRITIGTKLENDKLLKELKNYEENTIY